MRAVMRNERKFLINNEDFLRIGFRLQQALHGDPHNGAEGYLVRSLYFDTEYDDDYFDKAFGVEVRKKMRLRIYDPRAEFAMLEMKQKQGDQQLKRSLRMSREDALRLIDGDYGVLLSYPEPFAAECYGLMNIRGYRPRTVVDYQRMAFVAKENKIRITFDHKIRATCSCFHLFDPQLMMSPVLDESQAVLEVKYNGFLLSYMKDMLRAVDRSELSVSKYAMARQISYFPHL